MALVVDVDNMNLRVLADEPLLSEMWPVVSLTDDQMKEKYGRKVEDDEDDDKLIYCDVCKKSFKGSCNDHPLLWINNNKVSPCEDRAIKTLPSFLSVATSSIPKAGDGVFAKSDLPVGVVFGPYQGTILHNRRVADKTGYSWEIRKRGRSRRSEFVDGTDTKYANWLRYVNSARSESEQNLVAFQYVGFIWYKVFKPILDGEELLVWYGNDFGKSLGVFKTAKLCRKHPFIFS